MRVYIPATRRAALMLFRRGSAADRARAEAIHSQHQETARQLFDGITGGAILEAHQQPPRTKLLTIYHRSTRPGVLIQASRFFKDPRGEWTPISHHDIHTPADIDLTPGAYLTITPAT